tara:strand:- start:9841 stop:10056 length:216 start_codon:yes stop_codon:yes gene_type:complete
MQNNKPKILDIGDLVKKKIAPGRGRLAIVTEISMENYYEFNPWIRVVYADDIGGFEWIHRKGLQKLSKSSK